MPPKIIPQSRYARNAALRPLPEGGAEGQRPGSRYVAHQVKLASNLLKTNAISNQKQSGFLQCIS